MKLIFRNVIKVSPSGLVPGDVFVEGGKIVGPFEDVTAREIDGRGKYLMPGVIDSHVHFREPGDSQKEDWESGSSSAVMGGVTTVLDMPNNKPSITTVDALENKRDLIKGRSRANYGLFFGATKDNDAEISKAEGVVGLKVYMGSSTGDLLVDDSKSWSKIFELAKEKNIPVVIHAENEERIKDRIREFSGQDDPLVHTKVRDCECAKIALNSAIAIRKKIGNKLHVAHLSCRDELLLLKNNSNSLLTCEVCPHHLYFSDQDMTTTLLKMNPPLRGADDLRALWEGVRDGTVDILATDHAPHTLQEKDQVHWKAPAGVPGVEFLLPLMLNEVNLKMITFERLSELLCIGPARIFGLKGKGEIKQGMDADLVLVDMDKEIKITRDLVLSKCGWSPYEGYTLKGWPVMTVVNGEIVMENRHLTDLIPGREVEII